MFFFVFCFVSIINTNDKNAHVLHIICDKRLCIIEKLLVRAMKNKPYELILKAQKSCMDQEFF